MGRAFSALTAAAALLVAGCLGGTDPAPTTTPVEGDLLVDPATYLEKLSKAIYTEIVKERVKVPSFDGKQMDNWVYRPKAPEGTKVPVFINFSPYWTNLAPSGEAEGDNFAKYMIHEFVPRGYAVVLSSLRGTGYSEGCFNIGGDIEKKDAVAVIEYFAKQPWSNGNIAAGGKSYDGTTPQGAATLSPPALKAIFPVSGISELYKYNHKGGLAYSNGPIFNAYYYAGAGGDIQYGQPKTSEPQLIADDVACPELPEMQASGVGSGVTGDYTRYWTERNYTKDAAKVKAAVFFVHGFTDWNVKPDHILPWLDRIHGPKKVWLHNWAKQGDGGHVYPMRADWNLTMLRFLDQTLKGVETGIFREPAYELQDSAGNWHYETEWPPKTGNVARLLLSGKSFVSAPGSGTAQFTDEGTPNCSSQGANVLRYSAVMENGFRYSGEPIVHLTVKSDRAAGRLVALLCDGTKLINYGGLNLRHRKALEDPQPVVPDTWYGIQFPLFPQDDVLERNAALSLVLASQGGGFLTMPTGATISVKEDAASYIEFREGNGTVWHAPQPTPITCFAC